MDEKRETLSEQATAILKLIAEGRSYEQILLARPDLVYRDIFDAAQEALDTCSVAQTSYQDRLVDSRKTYPQAYKPWTEVEDADLDSLFQAGHSVEVIAARLGRQPTAIRSRIKKKGLVMH